MTENQTFKALIRAMYIKLDSLMSNTISAEKWYIYSNLKTKLAEYDFQFDKIMEEEKDE